MRSAVILLVLCAFACFASATSIRKSHLHSNSTLEHKTHTRDNFAATCRNIALSGTTLSAQCQNSNGYYSGTSTFDLNNCFSNINGLFACGGAYGQTAQSQSLSGTTLNARLQTASGNWMPSSVNLNSYISNLNGNLACDCYRNW